MTVRNRTSRIGISIGQIISAVVASIGIAWGSISTLKTTADTLYVRTDTFVIYRMRSESELMNLQRDVRSLDSTIRCVNLKQVNFCRL